MDLVIDANIVFSAIISSSGKTRDLIFLEDIVLFAPEFLLIEFEKHKQEIIEKSKLSKEDFELAIKIIFSRIKLVPFSEFKHFLEEAEKICPDPNDIEYFSLALSKDIPFWSSDKPLNQQYGVRIISTKEIIKRFE